MHVADPTDVDTWLGAYRQWMAGQGLARSTLDQRIKFAGARIAEWGTFDLQPYELAEYLEQFAGWTRRTYVNHLRSIYGWLTDSGQLPVSPMARYRTPHSPLPRAHPLTLDEARAVFSDPEATDRRLRAWLMLGMYAGLRLHEIAKFRGEDINEQTLRVVGKGGVDAALPTHPELWALARDHYPRVGPWFPSTHHARDTIDPNLISSRVRAHFRRHGIDEGGIHRMRHTYGTQLARAGVQPRVIQDLMRHSSLDTTMRYIAVVNEERAAAVRLIGLT